MHFTDLFPLYYCACSRVYSQWFWCHLFQLGLIGEGAFSEVFHGMFQGAEVAVKRLKVPLTSQDKNYFIAEVTQYIWFKAA